MKFLHLSDLHLGKRLCGFSLLEDQEYILGEILRTVREEEPDGVILAGDIYDRSVPPAEAVMLFDRFLTELAAQTKVFIISGNHDSAERLAFGAELFSREGVYLAPLWDGTLTPITLHDEYGDVNVYLLPFLKPVHVRQAFPDSEIETYTDAVGRALAEAPLSPAARNVLVTHQFVAGSTRAESEELTVGGTDAVAADVFAGFDYVALGHLHTPQSPAPNARYSGTPLPYSFSEAKDEKSLTAVTLGAKGDVSLRAIPLSPLHPMREIRGTYDELMARSYWDQGSLTTDYLHVILTDEEDIPDAVGRLRTVYHGLMKLEYDNLRTRAAGITEAAEGTAEKSPAELFADFYEAQNGAPLTEERTEFLQALIDDVWEVNP